MDRNYILDRVKSKTMSMEEFDFDRLTAPPLSMFFTPYDIADLGAIATSLRLSAKPKEKFQMIDQIMTSRGLVKFGAGTNRVVYRHPEFNSILFKIAYDAVGMQDNPAEFRNQFLLKPFVAKTFEVSPNGVIAIQERVQPIRSREEFRYISEDVFTLLTEWIIGRYIIADVGSEYFMNYGVRTFHSFGVVLLDYSYLYELDGNKIYCKAPDPNSPTGTCDGLIDYDDGFNRLYCTKCHSNYKAKELAKHIDTKMITLTKEGESKMKVTTTGGTGSTNNVAVDERKTNDEVVIKGSVKKVPNKSIKISNEFNSDNRVEEKKPELKPLIPTEDISGIHSVQESDIITDVSTEEEFAQAAAKIITSDDKSEIKSPISFGEKIENPLDDKKDHVFIIERAIEEIKNSLDAIVIDSVRDNTIDNIMTTLIDECKIDVRKYITIEEDEVEEEQETPALEGLVSINGFSSDETMLNLIKDTGDILGINRVASRLFKLSIDELEEEELDSAIKDDNFVEIIRKYFDVNGTIEYEKAENKYILNVDLVLPFEESDPFIYNRFRIDIDAPETDNNSIENDELKNTTIYHNAEIIDISTIDSKEIPSAVIVIKDSEGGYYKDSNNNIIAIDRIDDKDVDSITVTSKTWLDNTLNEFDSLKAQITDVDDRK